MPEEETQTTEAEQDSQTTDNEPAPKEEYERATLYFKKSTKRQFERWLNQMELDHNAVFDAEKREQHEALIHVAMNNEEEFVERLKAVKTGEI